MLLSIRLPESDWPKGEKNPREEARILSESWKDESYFFRTAD